MDSRTVNFIEHEIKFLQHWRQKNNEEFTNKINKKEVNKQTNQNISFLKSKRKKK